MKIDRSTKNRVRVPGKKARKARRNNKRNKSSKMSDNEFLELNECQQFAHLVKMAAFTTRDVANILGEKFDIIESIIDAGEIPPLTAKHHGIVQEKVDLFYSLLGTISGIAGESPEKVKVLFDHKDAVPYAPWPDSLRAFLIKGKLRAVDRIMRWLEGEE
jgi:hypothetical protein